MRAQTAEAPDNEALIRGWGTERIGQVKFKTLFVSVLQGALKCFNT